MLYRVTWIIDLDAESFEDAARKALEIQRNPNSIATHFVVRNEKKDRREIDLGMETGVTANPVVHVCVPLEEGIVRGVEAFASEDVAQAAERHWLTGHGLENPKDREKASDFGTGIAIWECEVKM